MLHHYADAAAAYGSKNYLSCCGGSAVRLRRSVENDHRRAHHNHVQGTARNCERGTDKLAAARDVPEDASAGWSQGERMLTSKVATDIKRMIHIRQPK